jgi:hypothetical protein
MCRATCNTGHSQAAREVAHLQCATASCGTMLEAVGQTTAPLGCSEMGRQVMHKEASGLLRFGRTAAAVTIMMVTMMHCSLTRKQLACALAAREASCDRLRPFTGHRYMPVIVCSTVT